MPNFAQDGSLLIQKTEYHLFDKSVSFMTNGYEQKNGTTNKKTI
jgi:hypothetical protein